MTAAIISWWNAKSPREQWLLLIAGVLGAAVLGWFLIIAPTMRAWASASADHAAAINREAAIAVRVASIRRLSATPHPAPTSNAAIDVAVAQAAAERGLTLARAAAQGNDAVAIAIANVPAPVLLRWLSELEAGGIIAADLSVRPNADGTVAMTATLRRAG